MSVTPWSADAPIDLEERVGELLGREPRLGPKALVAALAELADQSQSPVAYLDRELRYRYVNPAYERLLGRHRGTLLGRHVSSQLSEQGFQRLEGMLTRALSGEPADVQATFRTRAGDVRTLRRYMPHRDDSGVVGIVAVGGRTERNRVMVDRLTLLHALSTALTLAEDSETRSDFLLVHCMDFLGAEAGAVVMMEPDRGPGLWVTARLGDPLSIPSVGARIDASGYPLISRAFEDRWPQLRRDEHGWVRSVALPLDIDGHAIGVLLCELPEDGWLDEEDRSVLLALTEQGAQAFERARLLDAERRARSRSEAAVSRLRFLTAVSRSLALAPLEPKAVMEVLCSALVKGGVLFCAVHILDAEAGRLELFGLNHRNPLSAKRLREGMQAPIALEGTLPGEAVRSHSPLLHPELDPPLWGNAAPVLEEVLGQVETGQLLVVPLSLKQRTLGVVSILTADPQRPVEAEDVSLMQKVGDRAIIAFEAARAFEAERRALERSEAIRRHLERMHELSEALTGAVTPESVMRVLTERGRLVLNASESAGVLPDVDRGTLRWVAIATPDGWLEPCDQELRWDAQHPMAVVFRRGELLILEGEDSLLTGFPELELDPDGPPTTVLAVTPLRTHQGVLGVLAFRFTEAHPLVSEDRVFLRDLTRQGSLALERAGLYEAQAIAVGDRDEFLSIASHELRTPLTPLHLKLELLAREIAERVPSEYQDRLKTHLQVMRRQVRRMGELINGMLDLSRIDSGLLPLEPTEFHLPELIREVIHRHQEEMARAGCTLTLKVEGDGRGRWDRIRVEQVITNLLTNAFKYGAGRPIEIRVGEDGANVWFEVEDQGIGIAEKEVPRLFQRFARAVSERNYGGLGLGLYITRRIVESHGGSVAVVSSHGKGSIFRAQLPKWFLPGDASRTGPPPALSSENG